MDSTISPSHYAVNFYSFTATSGPTGADLAVTQTDSPDPVAWGQELNYRISVVNNGPSNATNVTVVDTLPANVLYTSAIAGQWSCSGPDGSTPGGTLTCTRPSLASGASDSILITVSPPNAVGTLTNRVSASADQPDPNTANNTASAVTSLVSYSISGRVADTAGAGISGVTIAAAGTINTTATTASNGTYTLSNLPAGTYTLTPSKNGYTFAPPSNQVSVPQNQTGVNFTGATASSGQPPAAPSNPQATALSPTQIRVSWQDKANNEDGFQIDDGTGVVASVGANATSTTIGGLAPGSYHCYSVAAYNSAGSSAWTSWACTTTPSAAPVANFDAAPLAGSAPLNVTFHNTSTGSITSCAWDYGDGTSDGVCDASHAHTYAAAGKYTVRLTVAGPGGSNAKTAQNYITVSAPAPTTFYLAGNVYVDTNQNGAKDSGELSYVGAGVTISGQATSTRATDANGNYMFEGLQAGSYTVTLNAPAGYRATTSNPVNVPLSANTSVNFGIVPTSTDTSKPGGVWVSPPNSFAVSNNLLHFEVHAYDNPGGSGVQRVNFTAFYSGQWHIVYTGTAPKPGTDIYAYDWDLSAVPAGPLTVSFDVYDNAGNSNLAPNGTRQGTLTDTTPPAAITNLAATTLDCQEGKVKLTWTAPGNNGSAGAASSYFIRYRTTPFVAPFDWLNATDVPNTLAPQPAGSQESFTISGLRAGQTYYFAVRAEDGAGNEALMSNTPTAAAGEMAPWTAMLYLDGDNNIPGYANLAPDYAALLDNLASAQDNPCVNIVAAFDPGGTTGSAYYKVEHTHPQEPYKEGVNKWSKPDLSMDDPNTLVAFIQWARSTYPAQHYFLSINDHGTGLSGLALDKSSGGKFLSVKNLGNALAAATSNGANKIDVVFADACYMAMVEDAYQIRNYANYYVASENEIFIQWKVYADYFSPSNLSKSTSPRDLAVSIVPKHASYLKPSTPYTISAVDLSQINNLVTAVNGLASSLKGQMATYAQQIAIARVGTQKFDTNRIFFTINADDESIDLYNFAQQIQQQIHDSTIQSKAQAVMDAIYKPTGSTASYVLAEDHETGVYDGHLWNLDNSHGVSIFFPRDGFRRSFYNGLNLDFAADAVWGKSLNAANAVQGAPVWGSMLVDYVAQVSPGAPDDPSLPELVGPLIPYRLVYLPLMIRR